MADTRLTDQQVADIPAVLKSEKSTLDAKVQYLNAIKSGIKQHNVPETCVLPLFDGLRTAASSQHAVIATSGFTALNHLFTRMSRQDPKLLSKQAALTLPLVIEKLGDQKDKVRVLAQQSLNTLYSVAPQDVERSIRNSGMVGKSARAKESSMQWLVQTHQENGLPFRSYVPLLMDLLEDADGMVRDVAKGTVIELFKSAPNAAKSDLKKQLKNFKVRPAIEQAIVKALAPNSDARSITPSEPEPAAAPPRPTLSTSTTLVASERPNTPVASTPTETVEPLYVNTSRELDDTMRDMAPHFEGKESEHNWMKREKSIITLRRLVAGNATDFIETLVTALRAVLDGIIKSVNSLRTSLSKEGCTVVQEIAMALGPAMDPLVELLMQTLLKLSAGTKKISSQMANTTVDIILSRVTYTPRLMQHVSGVFQDKNVQPRLYAAGWLRTILKKEAHHKSHIEHGGGLDLMEKCIRKGLTDANPGVREKMRATYWMFWGVWRGKADAIMADLDTSAQKLLNKDPNNPNGGKVEAPARPGLGLSKSTTGRPSLRDHVMAQKKANMTVKNLPPRPGSAMANLSPVRQPQAVQSHPVAPVSKPALLRNRQESSISVNSGGMSVAPMRPIKRRPEPPRPATAGPYSVRDQPDSMGAVSPDILKVKRAAPAPKTAETTPVKAAPARPGHSSHASESSVVSPSVLRSIPRPVGSPRPSPGKPRYSHSSIPVSSPTRAYESRPTEIPVFSSPKAMSVVPLGSPYRQEPYVSPARPVSQPEVKLEPREPVREATPVLQVYEDPFTEDQAPQEASPVSAPVLEEKPVNEDAAVLQPPSYEDPPTTDELASPEKAGQNSRLLDSGINKIKAKSLEVHGFRKMQSLIRDPKTAFTDQRFEALLIGLFEYLEDPLPDLVADKAQDVKAQILTTIKLLLKKERANFQPHVSRGLESLLQTRGCYDTRAHVVSGLELLADELVTLGDGSETVIVLSKRLQTCDDATVEGCRTLSMGLHVLKEMLSKQPEFTPTGAELGQLAGLAGRCLDSADSGVRMDAVKFCVALHARVGEDDFWEAMAGVKDDPKSLITYYIVKKQREDEVASHN